MEDHEYELLYPAAIQRANNLFSKNLEIGLNTNLLVCTPRMHPRGYVIMYVRVKQEVPQNVLELVETYVGSDTPDQVLKYEPMTGRPLQQAALMIANQLS